MSAGECQGSTQWIPHWKNTHAFVSLTLERDTPHGSTGVLKVRRGRQKAAIEELHRLHVARRIEPYDEVPTSPEAAVARGPQVHKADELCRVAFGEFDHGKAGTVQKQAHQTESLEGLHQGRVGALGDDL